jgi:hypothetical protein
VCVCGKITTNAKPNRKTKMQDNNPPEQPIVPEPQLPVTPQPEMTTTPGAAQYEPVPDSPAVQPQPAVAPTEPLGIGAVSVLPAEQPSVVTQPQFAPPFGQPLQQPQPPEPKNTDTLTIVGFVLAIVLPLLGLIISIVSLGRIKKTNGGGRKLALAGIIVSVVMMLVFAGTIFYIINHLTGRCAELGPGVHHVGAVTYTCGDGFGAGTDSDSDSNWNDDSNDDWTNDEGSGNTDSSSQVPATATPVNQTITDPELGYTITVKNVIRNIPIDSTQADGFRSRNTGVGVEVDIANNSQYEAAFLMSSLSLIAGGQSRISGASIVREYVADNNLPILETFRVPHGETASGWLFFTTDQDTSNMVFRYSRREVRVGVIFGENFTIPAQDFDIQLP